MFRQREQHHVHTMHANWSIYEFAHNLHTLSNTSAVLPIERQPIMARYSKPPRERLANRARIADMPILAGGHGKTPPLDPTTRTIPKHKVEDGRLAGGGEGRRRSRPASGGVQVVAVGRSTGLEGLPAQARLTRQLARRPGAAALREH